MTTDDENTFGLAGGRRTREKSVPKQRTAAENWSKLSADDKRDVGTLRSGAVYCRCPYMPCRCVSEVARTYVRRHG